MHQRERGSTACRTPPLPALYRFGILYVAVVVTVLIGGWVAVDRAMDWYGHRRLRARQAAEHERALVELPKTAHGRVEAGMKAPELRTVDGFRLESWETSLGGPYRLSNAIYTKVAKSSQRPVIGVRSFVPEVELVAGPHVVLVQAERPPEYAPPEQTLDLVGRIAKDACGPRECFVAITFAWPALDRVLYGKNGVWSDRTAADVPALTREIASLLAERARTSLETRAR